MACVFTKPKLSAVSVMKLYFEYKSIHNYVKGKIRLSIPFYSYLFIQHAMGFVRPSSPMHTILCDNFNVQKLCNYGNPFRACACILNNVAYYRQKNYKFF